MREIRECKIHGFTEFGLHKDQSVSAGYRWRCKACQRGYTAKNLTQVRKLANEIKTTAGCAHCGYNQFAPALHFAHKPGTDKSIDPCQARSVAEFLKEIEKCVIMCARCHVEWDLGYIEMSTGGCIGS